MMTQVYPDVMSVNIYAFNSEVPYNGHEADLDLPGFTSQQKMK